jgi:hypothetical protein
MVRGIAMITDIYHRPGVGRRAHTNSNMSSRHSATGEFQAPSSASFHDVR